MVTRAISFVRANGLWFGVIAAAAISLVTWRGVEPLTADSCEYIAGAKSLFGGMGYRNGNGGIQTFFPPGYPITIGLVNLVIADAVVAARAAALICSALTLIPLTLIARKLFGATVGNASAVLYAILPARVSLSSAVLSESVYLLMTVAAVWLWLKECESYRFPRAVLVGLLLGYGYLSRPEGILVILLLSALSVPVQRWWRVPRWQSVVLSLAAFAVVALPWIVFMHSATGRWDVTDKWQSSPASMILRSKGYSYQEMVKLEDNRDVGAWVDEWRETPKQMAKRYLKNLKIEARRLHGILGPFLFISLVLGIWLEFRSGNETLLSSVPVVIALGMPLLYLPIFEPETRLIYPASVCVMILACWQFISRFSPSQRGLHGRASPHFVGWIPFMVVVLFFVKWNTVIALGHPNITRHSVAKWMASLIPQRATVLAIEPQLCFLSGHRHRMLPNNSMRRVLDNLHARHRDVRYFVLRRSDLSIRGEWRQEAYELEREGQLRRVATWNGPDGDWAILFYIK